MRQVVGLETRTKVELLPGPELTIQGDRDQLEQLLINLVRNAAEAVEGRGDGTVRISTARDGDRVRLSVEDNGAGVDAALCHSQLRWRRAHAGLRVGCVAPRDRVGHTAEISPTSASQRLRRPCAG